MYEKGYVWRMSVILDAKYDPSTKETTNWYFNDTFHGDFFLDKWKQNLDGLAMGTLMEHFQGTATSP